jgi:hypothetical protein
MRRLAISCALAAMLALAFAVPAAAAASEPQVRVSHGDPFAGCVGVGADPALGGVNYPNAEVEPFVSGNPRNTRNLIAVWQQDRWNDGGAKGLVAGWSVDGGRAWSQTPLPFSACAASVGAQVAPFDRSSDPWVSIGPDGTAYGQGLVFDANDNHNGVASAISTDGGRTWGHLRLVIDDPASDPALPLDDKNSVTADPLVAGTAYAVWDRLVDVPCGAATPRALEVDDHPSRERGSAAPAQVCATGPTLFSRTVDGGRTWSPPRVIVQTAVNAQTIGNQIVVSRTGTLFDFFDFIDAAGVFHAQQVFSRDRGVTWSQPQAVGDIETAALNPGRPGVVDPRNPTVQLRTSDILPEPAVDPVSGRLYLTWQDARFNGGVDDQVVIATSADPLGRTGSWTAPRLVNPRSDPAAFNQGVVVNRAGQVAVLFQDFRSLDHAPTSILPTDTWVRVLDGSRLDLEQETRVSRTFNFLAAPQAGGFFVGDYDAVTASPRTGGFTAVWVSTNCAGTSCTAIANASGAPTGGPDPTDVFGHRVAGGDDQGTDQD